MTTVLSNCKPYATSQLYLALISTDATIRHIPTRNCGHRRTRDRERGDRAGDVTHAPQERSLLAASPVMLRLAEASRKRTVNSRGHTRHLDSARATLGAPAKCSHGRVVAGRCPRGPCLAIGVLGSALVALESRGHRGYRARGYRESCLASTVMPRRTARERARQRQRRFGRRLYGRGLRTRFLLRQPSRESAIAVVPFVGDRVRTECWLMEAGNSCLLRRSTNRAIVYVQWSVACSAPPHARSGCCALRMVSRSHRQESPASRSSRGCLTPSRL